MKKILSAVLILVLFVMTALSCNAEPLSDSDGEGFTLSMQINNPLMTVNGEEKEIDPGMGTVPLIRNNRTLIPVRSLIEEMGGTVSWNNEAQETTLSLNGDTIRLTVGSTDAYLNESVHTLDTPPVIINSRTFLPVRFIAESFKFNVEWDNVRQLISISSIPADNTSETDNSGPEGENSSESNQTLLVYFSRTGTTKALAEKISDAAGADMAEIVPVNPYPSDYNECLTQARNEINEDYRPEITLDVTDIDKYSTVIVGYPIWHGTLPPPVATFLTSHDFAGKTIVPFCTAGSTSIAGSLEKIRELCAEAQVAGGLSTTGDATEDEIDSWLKDALPDTTEASEDDMINITLKINEETFNAKLYSNEAALKLSEQFPATFNMGELNGNEKFCYLSDSLPTQSYRPDNIKTGDIMLYGSDCLVVFYKSFNSSYSYTRLGYVEDVEGLEAALGSGSIDITFELRQ